MRGEEALFLMLVVLVIALPLALFVGAIILRGGVSFANKCLPKEVEPTYEDWDDYDRPKTRGGARIPEPGLGKAMGIVLVNVVANFIALIPLRILVDVADADDEPPVLILVGLIQLALNFLIAAGLRSAMLPTTFPRACLVVVFEFLIVLGIVLVIGIPLALLAFMLG